MARSGALADAVAAANGRRRPLAIVGGGSKAFLGHAVDGQVLSTRDHAGVMDYRPEELVLRAKAGTGVDEVLRLVDAEGQYLPFEPPVHGSDATIGGMVATGLSGSGRPYSGAVRDFVLGVGMILHDGAYCEFGGQVMKNVAGYDVSRLACGSFGLLGVIADASFKVLPKPELEISVALELAPAAARELLQGLSRRVTPLSASCYSGGRLKLRLSGTGRTVAATRQSLGGEQIDPEFWRDLDIQQAERLAGARDLWRLSTEAAEPFYDYRFDVLDWGFCQRWLIDPERDPRAGYRGRGHWTRFRCDPASFAAPVFEPLPPVAMQLHRRIKSVFDPHGIFNPGRMYPGL